MYIYWHTKFSILDNKNISIRKTINFEEEKKKEFYRQLNRKIRGEKEEENLGFLQKYNSSSTVI